MRLPTMGVWGRCVRRWPWWRVLGRSEEAQNSSMGRDLLGSGSSPGSGSSRGGSEFVPGSGSSRIFSVGIFSSGSSLTARTMSSHRGARGRSSRTFRGLLSGSIARASVVTPMISTICMATGRECLPGVSVVALRGSGRRGIVGMCRVKHGLPERARNSCDPVHISPSLGSSSPQSPEQAGPRV
jgi:hypothetical protein